MIKSLIFNIKKTLDMGKEHPTAPLPRKIYLRKHITSNQYFIIQTLTIQQKNSGGDIA